MVGVHYQTMGYLERGEYNPSLELALKIARALEVSVQEIFWLDDDVTSPLAEIGKKGQRP